MLWCYEAYDITNFISLTSCASLLIMLLTMNFASPSQSRERKSKEQKCNESCVVLVSPSILLYWYLVPIYLFPKTIQRRYILIFLSVSHARRYLFLLTFRAFWLLASFSQAFVSSTTGSRLPNYSNLLLQIHMQHTVKTPSQRAATDISSRSRHWIA
jgi:hypothetical protein